MINRNEILEEIAAHLDRRAGNDVYRKAWKAAAKHVRSMKKLTCEQQKLTDDNAQIGNALDQQGR